MITLSFWWWRVGFGCYCGSLPFYHNAGGNLAATPIYRILSFSHNFLIFATELHDHRSGLGLNLLPRRSETDVAIHGTNTPHGRVIGRLVAVGAPSHERNASRKNVHTHTHTLSGQFRKCNLIDFLIEFPLRHRPNAELICIARRTDHDISDGRVGRTTCTTEFIHFD